MIPFYAHNYPAYPLSLCCMFLRTRHVENTSAESPSAAITISGQITVLSPVCGAFVSLILSSELLLGVGLVSGLSGFPGLPGLTGSAVFTCLAMSHRRRGCPVHQGLRPSMQKRQSNRVGRNKICEHPHNGNADWERIVPSPHASPFLTITTGAASLLA